VKTISWAAIIFIVHDAYNLARSSFSSRASMLLATFLVEG
jgi:ABC-type maltose transport system permease subunit